MAYYKKAALLVLNDTKTKFLVCQKDPQNVTADYIMPGGQMEEINEIETLKAEIMEELSCAIEPAQLKFLGEYTDVAAGRPDRDVSIKLYIGELIGDPQPTTEIKNIHWIGKEDAKSERVSPIIRNKIIPDLVKRGILK